MMVAGITTVAVVVARSSTSALVVASITTVAIGIVLSKWVLVGGLDAANIPLIIKCVPSCEL